MEGRGRGRLRLRYVEAKKNANSWGGFAPLNPPGGCTPNPALDSCSLPPRVARVIVFWFWYCSSSPWWASAKIKKFCAKLKSSLLWWLRNDVCFKTSAIYCLPYLNLFPRNSFWLRLSLNQVVKSQIVRFNRHKFKAKIVTLTGISRPCSGLNSKLLKFTALPLKDPEIQ